MKDSPRYHHTQFGYSLLLSLTAGGVITADVAAESVHALPPGAARTMALSIECVVALLVIAAAVIFSSLTIDVRDGKLDWHFTGKVIHGSVNVSDVAAADPVINSPGFGWGIRQTPEGRLYNVSGLGAVRITMRDGRRLSFGTDEPDRLAAAIAPLTG